MNLHKAKGLEAPVVFLADPSGAREPSPDLHVDRSGGTTRGYLKVTREVGQWHREPLAHPPSWQERLDEEKEFRKAEENRLRYVAVTRAGAKLIVSSRSKYRKKNPWKPLVPHLQDRPALEPPGEQEPPGVQENPLDAVEVRRASQEISRRRQEVLRPGYREKSARGEIVSRPTGLTGTAHGTEWGQVIHALLEARMGDPDVDLEALARSEVRHQDLPMGWARDAVETVRAVIESDDDIWQRACAGRQRLTEVPLRYRAQETDGTPVMSRGILDLAFLEEDGWVIVDYKTDNTERNAVSDLVDHYAPQLAAYRAGWERCVDEPVSEAGFFFTRAGCYVRCAPPDEA
jgi:ATP-dependent helicase/nuclease subunit A